MKPMRMSLVLLLLVFSVAPLAKSAAQAPSSQGQSSQTPLPPTLAADVDREISAVEKQVIDAAEAMPEEKFNFSPETLNIPGDDYKGVRSDGGISPHEWNRASG
jgi:hypothetical protein